MDDGIKTHADGCALVQFPGNACDCVDVARELLTQAKGAALAERAAVVAWLRRWGAESDSPPVHYAADAIERGEHTQPPPVAGEEG